MAESDLDVKELEAFLSGGLARPPGFEEGPEQGVYAGDPWADYKAKESTGYEWKDWWSKDAEWSKSNGWWSGQAGQANGKSTDPGAELDFLRDFKEVVRFEEYEQLHEAA